MLKNINRRTLSHRIGWRGSWERSICQPKHEILEEARVEPIVMIMRRRRLEWFGHVRKRDEAENSLDHQGGMGHWRGEVKRSATPSTPTSEMMAKGENCNAKAFNALYGVKQPDGSSHLRVKETEVWANYTDLCNIRLESIPPRVGCGTDHIYCFHRRYCIGLTGWEQYFTLLCNMKSTLLYYPRRRSRNCPQYNYCGTLNILDGIFFDDSSSWTVLLYWRSLLEWRICGNWTLWTICFQVQH